MSPALCCPTPDSRTASPGDIPGVSPAAGLLWCGPQKLLPGGCSGPLVSCGEQDNNDWCLQNKREGPFIWIF